MCGGGSGGEREGAFPAGPLLNLVRVSSHYLSTCVCVCVETNRLPAGRLQPRVLRQCIVLPAEVVSLAVALNSIAGYAIISMCHWVDIGSANRKPRSLNELPGLNLIGPYRLCETRRQLFLIFSAPCPRFQRSSTL